jgi:amidohydrolase
MGHQSFFYMKMLFFVSCLLAAWTGSLFAQPTPRETLEAGFQEMSPLLFELYRTGHQNPELGLDCFATSKRILETIQQLGLVEGRDYEILKPYAKTGFALILRNGEGPIWAWRFDLDGLPIREATGLPYAAPPKLGAMHACAHNIHYVLGVGILAQMHRNRKAWRGTAVFIVQPGEEGANGAKTMVSEGLFRDLALKNAFPQGILFTHAFDYLPAGAVGMRSGETMAGVAAWNLVLRSEGGHGGRKLGLNELAKDFEDFFYRIPTRVSPLEALSVNITGRVMDTTINVNPTQITLKISARFMNMALKDSVEQYTRKICAGLGLIYDLPDSTFQLIESFWSYKLVNDSALYTRMQAQLKPYFRDTAAIQHIAPIMSSEDATCLSTHILHPDGVYRDIPILMMRLGIQDPAKYGPDYRLLPGQKVPGIHTNKLAPAYERAIETGVVAFGGAFMELFRK